MNIIIVDRFIYFYCFQSRVTLSCFFTSCIWENLYQSLIFKTRIPKNSLTKFIGFLLTWSCSEILVTSMRITCGSHQCSILATHSHSSWYPPSSLLLMTWHLIVGYLSLLIFDSPYVIERYQTRKEKEWNIICLFKF